jgi:hypothetical protein
MLLGHRFRMGVAVFSSSELIGTLREITKTSRMYLVVMGAWVVRVADIPLIIEIRRVEQLVQSISRLPAARHVRADVVEVAEAAGEGDVLGVTEACLAEDAETILGSINVR